MSETNLFIDGHAVPARSAERFARLNPLSGREVTSAAAAGVEDATRAADAATRAFASWSQTTPARRRQLLLAAAAALEAASDALTAAMQDEIGATEVWARENIRLGVEQLQEAAAIVTAIKGEILPSNRPGATAMAMRVPVGVVLSIAPWNAPVALAARAIALPLACGNTVVLKVSELCPRSQTLLAEVIAAAGFPPGVLNTVSHAPRDAPAITEALIAHPGVRRVNFTGSTRVGRMVAEMAARQLKPALLELGGKAPLIVLEDADIDATVEAAVWGAYANSGQICMSTERIITVGAVGDIFARAFASRVAGLKAGDPRLGCWPLGPVASPEAAARIRELVQDAQWRGASLLAGGGGTGALLDAVALDHVTPAMRIYHEEIFGPVATIIRAGSVDEAVSIANDSDFGLAAAVFGRDLSRAAEVARRIESGICHINGPTLHDEAHMPFGGVKASGSGRFGGQAGIAEFTELRWITAQTDPLSWPI